MTPRTLFRTFAFAELVTWTLLISALIARALGANPVVVVIAGSIHGAVFLSYGTSAALVGVNGRWRVRRIVLGVAVSIVPYATLPFEIVTDRAGLLAGPWRREHSGHPADDHWFDRLFRWFIARPLLLIVVLIAVVTLVYLALVSLGPPTEWFSTH